MLCAQARPLRCVNSAIPCWRAAAPRSSFLSAAPNIEHMLIDYAMPGMSGAEVARRVETTRPVVAHPRYGLCGPGGAPLCERSPIGKPFVDTELHEKVRRPWRGGASARSCASDLPEAPEPTRSFHVTSSLRRSK